MATPDINLIHDELCRRLVDDGKLIEAGFVGLRKLALHPDAPASQLSELRMAFFAGAQHLFGAIMAIMDPGSEPTDKDLARMDQIDAELKAFIAAFKLRLATKGSG